MFASPTLDKYHVGKTLGSGIAKVKLVQDSISELTYAAKISKVSSAKLSLAREASILHALNQAGISNIIKIIDFLEPQKARKESVQPPGNNTKEYQYNAAIIMELAPNGTLFDYVYSSKGFEEKLARSYFRELILALDGVHSLGYVHRDIKLENILLDDQFRLKLADFGFARDFNEETKDKMTTKLGMEYFMAPEMRQLEPYSGVHLDVFACGVLLFVLLFGRPPFFQATSVDQLYRYFAEERPEKFWRMLERKLNDGKKLDSSLKLLLNDLLARDPAKRPSAGKILEYEWMQGGLYQQEEVAKVMTEMKRNMNQRDEV